MEKASQPGGAVRAVGRALSWPLRRFLDPRFDRIQRHVDARHEELMQHLADLRREALELNHEAVVARGDIAATSHRIEDVVERDAAASNETAALVGRSLADLLERSDEILAELRARRPS
jgi:hypothetical protein